MRRIPGPADWGAAGAGWARLAGVMGPVPLPPRRSLGHRVGCGGRLSGGHPPRYSHQSCWLPAASATSRARTASRIASSTLISTGTSILAPPPAAWQPVECWQQVAAFLLHG